VSADAAGLSSRQLESREAADRLRSLLAERSFRTGRLEKADLWPDLIGGMTMGADPVSYAVAGESWRRGREPVHAFSVRKEAKEHGRGRRIEGCFEEGSRVVVAEDVITTGGSALDACRAVESAGGEIMAVLVLVDRQEGGRERLEDAGYRVLPLYTTAELEAEL